MTNLGRRMPILRPSVFAAVAALVIGISSPSCAENWFRFAPLYQGDGATCIDLDSIKDDKGLTYFSYYDIGPAESCAGARNVRVIKVAISCPHIILAAQTHGDFTPIKYHVLYPNARNWQLMDVGPNKEFGARVVFVCRR